MYLVGRGRAWAGREGVHKVEAGQLFFFLPFDKNRQQQARRRGAASEGVAHAPRPPRPPGAFSLRPLFEPGLGGSEEDGKAAARRWGRRGAPPSPPRPSALGDPRGSPLRLCFTPRHALGFEPTKMKYAWSQRAHASAPGRGRCGGGQREGGPGSRGRDGPEETPICDATRITDL